MNVNVTSRPSGCIDLALEILLNFYPPFVFLSVLSNILQSWPLCVCGYVDVYEKFPFFTAELLEIDKQKPWYG